MYACVCLRERAYICVYSNCCAAMTNYFAPEYSMHIMHRIPPIYIYIYTLT